MKKRKESEPKILKYSFLLIIIVGVLVNFQTLFFDFIKMDDDHFIIDNPQKVETLTNFKAALTKSYLGSYYYRPIPSLTFFMDYQIAGSSAFMFHLTNLIIHLITSCMVFILFRKINYNKIISFIVALIFSIHPILTNAVNWVVGRNDMLAGLFSILSMVFFIDYFNKQRWYYQLLIFLSLLIAMFSKEFSMTMPFVLGVYWLIFYRNRKFDLKSIFLILALLLPLILQPLIKFLVIQIAFTDPNFNIFNFFINFREIPETVAKIILPVNIEILPTFDIFNTISGSVFIIFAIILISIRKTNIDYKKLLFGFLWFSILYVPGVFVRVKNAAQFFDYLDCRTYLPILGIFIILIELISSKYFENPGRKLFITTIILLFVLSSINIAVGRKYKNAEVYWESAAKNNPERATILGKLGQIYFKNNKQEKAILILEKAIQLDTNALSGASYIIYADLANANFKKGNIDNAIKFITKSIEKEPGNPTAYLTLGYYLTQKKNYQLAAKFSRKALDIYPDYKEAYQNLFCLYYDNIKNYDTAAYYAFEYVKRGGNISIEILKFLEPYRHMR